MHRCTAARLLLLGVLLGARLTLEAAETLTVTASQARVYARPDAKSRVLATLPRGTTVSLREQRTGWYQITLTDGNTGWVSEALVARAPEAIPTRGIELVSIRDRQGQQVGLYTASYALVIGVSGYTNGWPPLPGVLQDVAAVTTMLQAQGVQVESVRDPTLAELRRAFDDFIHQYGNTVEARLLIYFAGHGHTLKLSYGAEMGYLVPRDAPSPSRDEAGFRARALSMQEIEVYARRIQSKHVLFLFDSCFSGSIFSLSRAVPEHITYKTSRPVRQFITSGQADELVPDVSIFRRQLVAALQGEGDTDGDGYVTGAELGEFLQKQVVNYSRGTQHPQYGKLRDPFLDKGDFVFTVTRPALPGPSLSDLQAQVEAQRQQVQAERQRLEEAQRLREEQQKLRAEQERLRQEREKLQGGGPPTGPQVAVGVYPQQPQTPPASMVGNDGAEMVLVPAGEFIMGSDADEINRLLQSWPNAKREFFNDEIPRHRVYLDAFYIDKYEVTNTRFQRFVEATGHRTQAERDGSGYVDKGEKFELVNGANWRAPRGPGSSIASLEQHPVVQVSHEDAKAYCAWAGKRLPTEAEWEKAARGTDGRSYPWGNQFDGKRTNFCDVNCEFNWKDNAANGGYRYTAPVGSYEGGKSSYGAYDMAGNVWEWVADWYDESYYKNSPTRNPQGPASGTQAVLRGGGWDVSALNVRAPDRVRYAPASRNDGSGLRCANTL